MADQRPQEGPERVGESDHPQHRTPPGEGSETPLSEKEGGPAEMSLYDGMGNETSAVLTEDEQGFPRQGTGKDREDAIEDAKDPDSVIGQGFNPTH